MENMSQLNYKNDTIRKLYDAIISNDVKGLSDIYVDWTDGAQSLDRALSEAYEDAKLKNINLSNETQFCVEQKLVEMRFFCDDDEPSTDVTLDEIRERVEIMLEAIEILETEHSRRTDDDREGFLYVAKYILQNLFILKRHIKTTYGRLPWEEMEFCLIVFISANVKREPNNIFYKTTLTTDKMLNHLKCFAANLEKEKELINRSTIKSLMTKPRMKRENVVKEIIKECPRFQSLYDDFTCVRDIYSLQKINDCIKDAVSTDSRSDEGKLVIIKCLQSMGENLKNTLDSPKLSDTVNDFLLALAPNNTKDIITLLRDSLSHIESLSKRTAIQANTELRFFMDIQNDMKKLNNAINSILHKNKNNLLKKLLRQMIDDEETEMEKVLEAAQDIDEVFFLIGADYETNEHQRIQDRIESFKTKLGSITKYESSLFDAIAELMEIQKSGVKNLENDSDIFAILKTIKINQIHGSNNREKRKRLVKVVAENMLNIERKPLDVSRVPLLLKKILDSVNERTVDLNSEEKNIKSIYSEIIYMIMFQNEDIRWVEDFGDLLVHKDPQKNKKKKRNAKATASVFSKEEIKKLLETKVSSLDAYLKEKSERIEGKNLGKLRDNREAVSTIEMLTLDIMTILGELGEQLTNIALFNENLLILDTNLPILTGKTLRNHLAHENTMLDVSLVDTSISILANADIIRKEDIIGKKRKIGKSMQFDGQNLRATLTRGLSIINRQREMYAAAERGEMDKILNCIKEGADANGRTIFKWTILHFAAKGGNVEVFKSFYEKLRNNSERDSNGDGALHVAAAYGNSDIVQYLLDRGLDVDDPDNKKQTPLHLAAQNGHYDTVKVLLNHNANSSVVDMYNYPALHYAAENNKLDVVKILIEHTNNVDQHANLCLTPLHVAAINNCQETVKYLLDNRANIDAKTDDDYATALYLTTLMQHKNIVNILVTKGANVDVQTMNGLTPLHAACANEDLESMRILLERGANANTAERILKMTPLHQAAKSGNLPIVEMLLKYGVFVDATLSDGSTPLHMAAYSGQREIIEVLLKHKASLDCRNVYGFTPLHVGVIVDCLPFVEQIINFGAQVNTKDVKGNTPLHSAAQKGNCDIAMILIRNGANVNEGNDERLRPLHTAAKYGHQHIVNILMDNAANPVAKDDQSREPLHYATKYHETFNVMLTYDVDTACKDTNNWTTLHWASTHNNKQTVEAILNTDIYVDCRNDTMSTPLHLATLFNHTEIAKMLIHKNATVNVVNDSSFTPLHYATRNNNKELVKLLLSRGADVTMGSCNQAQMAAINGNISMLQIFMNEPNFDVNKNVDQHGHTLMHIAAFEGYRNIVDLLTLSGAEVDNVNSDNVTPLFIAAKKGHKNVLEYLIIKGANVNMKCVGGKTPVHASAEMGHHEVLGILLDNKGDPYIRDDNNKLPVQLATMHGHVRAIETIFRRFKMNEEHDDGYTLLHIAALAGHIDVVKYLTNYGMSLHAKYKGMKPIHKAIITGRKEIVKYFLRNGVSIDTVDDSHFSLLHYATQTKHADIAKYLIKNGIDVNYKDDNVDLYPLDIALNQGDKDLLKLLLDSGAMLKKYDDLNEKSKHDEINIIISNTLNLFDATDQNDLTNYQSCINNGASVNAKNICGLAPSQAAARRGGDEGVRLLLEAGANVNAIDRNGKRPLHHAAENNNKTVVEILLANGAAFDCNDNFDKMAVDYTKDTNIRTILEHLNDMFEAAKRNDINDLITITKSINNSDMLRIILNVRNENKKSIISYWIHEKFDDIYKLKDLLLREHNTQLANAKTFIKNERYQNARTILQSMVEEYKDLLGPNSLWLVHIEKYIAKIFLRQNDYEEALRLTEKIYQIQKCQVGSKNIASLKTKRLLASIHVETAGYSMALDICEKIMKNVVQNSKHEIKTKFVRCLALHGLQMYKEATDGCFDILETKHTNTVIVLKTEHLLGVLSAHRGEPDKALSIFQRVYETRKKILGAHHTDTLSTQNNMASMLKKMNKLHESLNLYQNIREIQIEYQKNNLDLLITEYNIGTILFQQGKYNKSLDILKTVLTKMKSTLKNGQHPYIATIERSIDAIKIQLRLDKESINKYLLIASCNGDTDRVQDLLRQGVDANSRDVDGMTPLHYAVQYERTRLVETLLKAGAGVVIANFKGETPFDIATRIGNDQILKLLMTSSKSK